MKLALALAVLVCGFLSFEIHSLRNENQRLQAKLESLSDSMALGSIRPEPDGDTTSKKTAQNPSLEKILEYRRRLAEKRGKLSEIIKKIEALKGKAKPVPTADPAELDRRIREKKELLAGMRKRLRVVRENLKPQGSSHEYHRLPIERKAEA